MFANGKSRKTLTVKSCYLFILMGVFLGCIGCQGPKVSQWEPVWEVPPEILQYVKEGGELPRARSRSDRFSGVIPRAFKNAEGDYRICMIKKDPLRDSYWYEMYQFSADGSAMQTAMSSIPSTLKEPDPEKIPGW